MKSILIIPAWFDSRVKSKGIFIEEFVEVLNADPKLDLCMLNVEYFSIKNIFAYWKAKEPQKIFAYDILYVKSLNLKSRLLFFLNNETILRYYNKKVLNVIKRQKRTFDLIHCQSLCNNVTPFLVNHISKSLNIPYIVTEHYSSYKESKGAVFEPYLNQEYVIKVAQNASKRIAVSNFAANKYENYFNSKFEIIYNIISEKFVTESIKKKNKTFTFISIGAFESHKGVIELLKAFYKLYKKSNDVRLILIGKGSLEPELLNYISDNNLENVIFLKAWMDKQMLILQIDKSHVLVSASNMETFGLTIAEGLLRGIPVIATKSGGPCEFVNERNGILVNLAEKEEGLFNAMMQVKTNYDHYKREQIQKDAIAKFRNDNIVNAYIELYGHVTLNYKKHRIN